MGGQYYFRRRKKFNEKLAGAALSGQIVRTERETAYIKLDIDGNGGQASYPYPWSPVSGNLLYSMPQLGTKAYLYFPDCHEERAFVGSGICTIEDSSRDSQEREFCTEHGKRLQMYVDSITLKGGRDMDPQTLSLKDDGCILKAENRKLILTASDCVKFIAPCIIIRTPLEINQLKNSRYAREKGKQLKQKGSRNPATGGNASLTMQYEFNGVAEQGVLEGTQYEKYFPFADEPAYEIIYPKEAKILGGVVIALLLGVVVGLLAVIATPLVITLTGISISAIGFGVVAGSLISATGIAATALTAAQDDGTTPFLKYYDNIVLADDTVIKIAMAFFAAQFAANTAYVTLNPFDMSVIPLFGQPWSAATLAKIFSIGAYGATSSSAFFSLSDIVMSFLGKKELGEPTGNRLYDSLWELSDLAKEEFFFSRCRALNYIKD